jgi:hypothetical protein
VPNHSPKLPGSRTAEQLFVTAWYASYQFSLDCFHTIFSWNSSSARFARKEGH